MSQPNLLLICTDQQRYDTIAALGNAHIRTPHIDSLVRAGVAFERAYCQSPVCSPSRASFLTGRYPRTTGCRQNGQSIRASERLLSRILADHGYACGLAGKQHLAACSGGRVESRIDDGYVEFHWSHHPQPDWPENAYTQWLNAQGVAWDELYQGQSTAYVKHGIPAQYHQTTWCAEMAIDFMRRHREQPWFFNFNCFDPHHPFDPPQEYLQRYDPDDMPLPKYQEGELDDKPVYQRLDHQWAHNEPEYFSVAGMTPRDQRQVTAAYYAMIELIDDQVGRMIAALAETGQLDHTLVVFMSDHGEMLGDHGLYLKGPHFYEQAVRVPLILRFPARFSQDLRADALVELVDLAPTLLKTVGITPPESMQGRSLVEICRGRADPSHHRDFVYSEYYNAWTHPHSYGTMLRNEDQKIVVYHGVDDGEFYDLRSDPDEFENLWFRSEHAAARSHLLKMAFDASVFTMDPEPPRLGPFSARLWRGREDREPHQHREYSMAFTLCLNTSTIKPQPMLDKIRLAAEAGFAGVEIWLNDVYEYIGRGGEVSDIEKALSDHGLFVPCTIAARSWAEASELEYPLMLDEVKRRLELAARLGSPYLVATPPRDPCDLAQITRRYCDLLQLGRAAGVRPTFEYISFFRSVHQLQQAWQIVRDANDPDATLILDAFHSWNSKSTLDDLRAIPVQRISHYHIDDAHPEIPAGQQTDPNRVMLGDGVIDLKAEISVLKEKGYQGTVSLELFNQRLWEMDPREVLRIGIERMRELLD